MTRNRVKRITWLVVLAMMIVCLCPTIHLSAVSDCHLAIRADKATVAVGEKVTVTLSNTEMTAASLAAGFYFDPDALECTKVTYYGMLTEDDRIGFTASASTTEANANGLVSFSFAGSTDETFLAADLVAAEFTAKTAGAVTLTTFEDMDSVQYGPYQSDAHAGDAPTLTVTTVSQFTVTFKNYNGDVLQSGPVTAGEIPTAPSDPTRPEDNTYTYTFTGWSPALTAVTGEATYTAQYSAAYKNYSVTFKDDDGTVLAQKTNYHYGDALSVPADPTKAATTQYQYAFAGWTPAVPATVTASATYTATYTQTARLYTLTFLDENDNVIAAEQYPYGSVPEEPFVAAAEGDDVGWHEFTGWTPELPATVTGDATFHASYEHTYYDFAVTTTGDNGTVTSDKALYKAGETVTLTVEPDAHASLTSLTATGVNGPDELVLSAVDDTTYTFTMPAEPVTVEGVFTMETVTLTLSSSNGTSVTGSGEYDWGTLVTATAIQMPNEEFLGWFDGDTMVSDQLVYSFTLEADTALEARYEEDTTVRYTLTVNAGEYLLSGEQQYDSQNFLLEAGTSVTLQYNGTDQFLYWINATKKIVTTEKTVSFPLTSSTTYTAITVRATLASNSAMVVFKSSFDQILANQYYTTASASITFPTAPSRRGFSFAGWSMTQDAIMAEIAKPDVKVVEVMTTYAPTNEKYQVTVDYQDTEGQTLQTSFVSPAINAGNVYSLSAAGMIGDKVFAYWKNEDDKVLSYETDYCVYSLIDVTLTAVYADTAPEKDPLIMIADIDRIFESSKYKVTFTMGYYLPEDCTVVQVGMIRTTNMADATESILNLSYSGQSLSTIKTNTGTYTATYSTGADANKTVYLRAFVTFQEDGETKTIMTEIVSASYNSLG